MIYARVNAALQFIEFFVLSVVHWNFLAATIPRGVSGVMVTALTGEGKLSLQSVVFGLRWRSATHTYAGRQQQAAGSVAPTRTPERRRSLLDSR